MWKCEKIKNPGEQAGIRRKKHDEGKTLKLHGLLFTMETNNLWTTAPNILNSLYCNVSKRALNRQFLQIGIVN